MLNERRIADAQVLLRQDKQAVKSIAEQVGFNSVVSFNRVSRDMVGMTPTAFRGQAENEAG